MMHRFSAVFCVFALFCMPILGQAQSTAARKAKVADQLEAIQQDIMDLQNAVLAYHETGHCRSCQNQVALLEQHMAEVAWFLVAQKPSYVRAYLAPSVAKLQTWMDEPDAMPNVHQILGDLMTRTAYEVLLMGDLVWDDVFWERAKNAWPAEKGSLGFSNSALKRAEKRFQKAVQGH